MTDETPTVVLDFPVKPRPKPLGDPPLSVVPKYSGCQHKRVKIDVKLSEVTCRDCKERLNPIYVLEMLSHEDSVLRQRWMRMRAELEVLKATMEARTRCKCDYCGRMTKVNYRLPEMAVYNIQQKLEREDQDK